MLLRALALWGLLLLLAILNGGLREGVLTPRLGAPAGHVASTLLLAALILGATAAAARWLALPDRAAALRVGALWVALTLAFEFLAGHFLFRRPWAELLSDYNVAAGRIWILIPAVILLAPLLTRRAP